MAKPTINRGLGKAWHDSRRKSSKHVREETGAKYHDTHQRYTWKNLYAHTTTTAYTAKYGIGEHRHCIAGRRMSTRTHGEHKTKKMSMVVRHKSADCSARYTPFVVVKGLPHPHENHSSDRSRVSRALEEALGHEHLLHDLVNNETRIHVMERTCMNSQSLNHRIGTCTRTRAYREARAARLAQQVERDLPDKVYQIKFKIRT